MLFNQDTIEQYLASCARRPKSSTSLGDEGDASYEDEDAQTKREFDEFKKWLDENSPAGSSTIPSSKAKCPKCGKETCV